MIIGLSDLQDQIKQRIQAHADRNGLTFDQAYRKAKIQIAGQEFKLDIQSNDTGDNPWLMSTSPQAPHKP